MRHLPPLAWTLGVVAALSLLALAQACGGGTHIGTVAPGGDCEAVSDCQSGYVCIEQPTGPKQCCGTVTLPSGQCANNLMSIQNVEEAGTSGMMMMPPMDDGAAPGDATAPPPVEAGSMDAASPMDSGSPVKDGGGAMPEAAAPETGAPEASAADTGSTGTDAASE